MSFLTMNRNNEFLSSTVDFVNICVGHMYLMHMSYFNFSTPIIFDWEEFARLHDETVNKVSQFSYKNVIGFLQVIRQIEENNEHIATW
jgi:hypothetical protein